MRRTQFGILFALLLLTATELNAEPAEDRAALAAYLNRALSAEDGFEDRYAVSRVGAQGLMQVMPFWKDEIGRSDDNLTHTPTNLRYGCHILRFYLDREDQNLNRALAAYNGSSGSPRYPNKVRAAWENRWRTAPIDW